MHALAKKPLYLHGLEGSPQGVKGAWMMQRYGANAPNMPAKMGDPHSFDRCFDIAAKTIHQAPPRFIVGSSFGGALLMKLSLEGLWGGPSIYIAQAGVRYGLGKHLPSNVPAILIHGKQDTLIPHADSQLLADHSGPRVLLWLVEGSHKLHHIIHDGTLDNAISTVLTL